MNLLARAGPGVLYAASAIGISHIVQSTRAGAEYGLGLVGAVLLFALLKYPSIRFGGEYTAITGETVIASYARQGRAVLLLVAMLVGLQMCIAFAAVLATTAGLFGAVLNLGTPLAVNAAVLVAVTWVLLLTGRYRALEWTTKALVLVLAVAVTWAAALALPQIDAAPAAFLPPPLAPATLVFCLGLAGFLPTPVDGSLLQSVWTAEKLKAGRGRIGVSALKLDFDIGYFGAVFLALCFLVLGAGVMYGRGEVFADSAVGFAAQVLALFTASIGASAYPLIAVAALAVMYSTVLVLADGFPRVMADVVARLAAPRAGAGRRLLPALVVVQGILGVAVIVLFLDSFKRFIDLITLVSFLMSPLIAGLNHRAMFGPAMPVAARPSEGMRRWSLGAVVVLALIAGAFMALTIGR